MGKNKYISLLILSAQNAHMHTCTRVAHTYAASYPKFHDLTKKDVASNTLKAILRLHNTFRN